MKIHSYERQSVSVFEISGNLRGTPDSYAFLEDVRTRITEGAEKIIVDLGSVERLDSAGVGILASIVSSANNAGAALRFSSLSDRTERPIRMVGLAQVMEIAPTLDEALRQINEG